MSSDLRKRTESRRSSSLSPKSCLLRRHRQNQKWLSGETTIFGTCFEAGGDPAFVKVELDDGQKLRVPAPKAVAQSAAKRLYQPIGLTGQATWDSITYEMLTFNATALSPFKGGDPVASFRKLAELSAGRLDNVTAAQFVAEVRGGTDDAGDE